MFIELTTVNGNKILLQEANMLSIAEWNKDQTRIQMVRDYYTVVESYDTIKFLLQLQGAK